MKTFSTHRHTEKQIDVDVGGYNVGDETIWYGDDDDDDGDDDNDDDGDAVKDEYFLSQTGEGEWWA